MKNTKLWYWLSTTIIFLFEGVMPAATSQTEMAKTAIAHLEYPAYFGVALTVFKVLGAAALIIPQIPHKLKEWAYAGLTFSLIFASISNTAINGFGFDTIFPFVVLGILFMSYYFYYKHTGRMLSLNS